MKGHKKDVGLIRLCVFGEGGRSEKRKIMSEPEEEKMKLCFEKTTEIAAGIVAIIYDKVHVQDLSLS